MGKRRFTENGWSRDPWFRALCEAIRSCETYEEVALLLRDLGSLSELQAWSERLEVAKQLSQGLTYREVAKNTGASTTTVTRIAKTMENGTGAYKAYLQSRAQKELQKPESNDALRKYL